MPPPNTELLTAVQVRERLGVSHVTLWRWVRAGLFPKPIKPGAAKLVRWLSREVDEHIEARAAERDTSSAA